MKKAYPELICSNCGAPVTGRDALDQEGAAYVTCRACAAEGDHADDLADTWREDCEEER